MPPPVHFTSCEDHLGQVAGLYNAACSATGVVIMALPLRTIWAARTVLGASTLDLEALLYQGAQFLLFYLNLHQHATGNVAVDLDSGGALHSIFLFQWLHNNPLQVKRIKENGHPVSILMALSNWRAPKFLTSVITWSTAAVVLGTCFLAPEKQLMVASFSGSVVGLYPPIVMGLRSFYIKTHGGSSRHFRLWAGACLSLMAVQWAVVLEEKYVCQSSLVMARYFHSVVVHSLILSLFYCVSECAIGLVNESRVFLMKDKKR
mmetsp:Transcript_22427/g.66487  ORF Transcript_22427/g.66487 Transcript_22427/m.66487 type:complete len:262 (-) Transcript_22427:126-911(-)